VARRKLAIGPLMGLWAAAGLLLATWLHPPEPGSPGEDSGRTGLLFALAGAAAGAVWSYWRLPDAKVCRIPRWLGGCGGSSKIEDTAGNSRPRRPCWGHPGGRPKRVVHLLLSLAAVALGVGLVAVLVTAAR
jgi:hypothetical protein